MSTRLPLPLAVAAGALVLSQPRFAQEREDLTIPVGECVTIEDSLERFACYERMVEVARAGDAAHAETEVEKADTAIGADANEAAPASTATPAGVAEPARPAPRQAVSDDSFGFPVEADRPERGSQPEIRSIVAAVEESRPNLLTVTLENGQIWRQMQSQRYNLRAGHHVRISGTRWGDSYHLSADELYGFIQVERVK
ncbi:MAG TPA: hypothetical protein VMR74_05305 [Gammaproteobacteria bacterium]|nr:hypothetical protein [Gammaproteobacteria bacterium]